MTFSTTDKTQLSSLLDLRRWSELMAWQRISKSQQLYFSSPSQGIGAHASIEHQLATVELTITKQTPQGIHFSVLFNNEHSAQGQVRFVQQDQSTTVIWQISGTINSTLLGGYAALYLEYNLRQLIISAFNNLQTELKLRAAI
ncbi:hypothetical protein [Pseudoalteromonas sp. A25]|uniref:hypothetical protein n=1 Tax=Pseudoalteromonas sp. A25 TaxID=116092 RepID=UPI00126112EE|nr:hypothetical protein [Pseudoalteromonas sp. A25]